MNYRDIIFKWTVFLGLTDWSIETQPIMPSQVLYDSDIPPRDKYFIGIAKDEETKEAIIYHDRYMTEEDILHELIHLRYPNYTEEQVNNYCDTLIS